MFLLTVLSPKVHDTEIEVYGEILVEIFSRESHLANYTHLYLFEVRYEENCLLYI
jgi:hypothetical protein